MNFLTILASVALVAATVGLPAKAATYDVDFTGTDGSGAVTADMVLNVVGGQVVSGTGTISQAQWGTAKMTFLSSPNLSTVYEFNGGTELFGDDNAFPISGNGIVFNVGTAATPGSQYQTGGGFAIWSTGGNTYQTFLADGVNGSTHLWEYVSGTATVSAVPLPGALPLFGSALVGIGALARRRRAKKAA